MTSLLGPLRADDLPELPDDAPRLAAAAARRGRLTRTKGQDMTRVSAPFTDDQIASLNAYQIAGVMHPFTCANRGDEATHPFDPLTGDRGVLVATADGWRCPRCDYRQDWAHDFIADWSWRSGSAIARLDQLDTLMSTPRSTT